MKRKTASDDSRRRKSLTLSINPGGGVQGEEWLGLPP